MALAAAISPNTYGSSTIGGKKPTVCSIAMPFCSRYTQASSLVSNPTSRFGSSNRGRRVKISFRAPRPNFAAQPALLVIWVSHCFSAIANTFFFSFYRNRQPDARRKRLKSKSGRTAAFILTKVIPFLPCGQPPRKKNRRAYDKPFPLLRSENAADFRSR